MPYIPADERDSYTRRIPATAGQLNYAITCLIVNYLNDPAGEKYSYQDYNEVMGVLECAKLELYRRMVVPYEILKQGENGDVYP